nr:growth hormone-regulated TBC protein 1 [Vulpes vulpes]
MCGLAVDASQLPLLLTPCLRGFQGKVSGARWALSRFLRTCGQHLAPNAAPKSLTTSLGRGSREGSPDFCVLWGAANTVRCNYRPASRVGAGRARDPGAHARSWAPRGADARGTFRGAYRSLYCRIDPYGFERPEDFDYAAYEEFLSTYLVILTRRAIKWSKLLKGSSSVQRSGTVKRYIRKGVPLEHRARVWMGVSGAQAQMDQNPGYYHRLLQGERSDRLEEAIRTDMNRTFPDNVKFRKNADPCLQKTLYNILLAYGRHNEGVGYCQGMNFIAGYLLLVTKSEEESFWLLDALLGRILPDYYGPAMLGLKTDQEVLGELVKTKLPAVAALMDGHGVLWTLVVSRWFICLFVDILPVETVFRIWDCLFNEGSKIIFRVALTLIKQHQGFILEATSVVDICERFKEITRGSLVTDCHTFMQKIFSEPGSLSMATITRLRESCRAKLLAQG